MEHMGLGMLVSVDFPGPQDSRVNFSPDKWQRDPT